MKVIILRAAIAVLFLLSIAESASYTASGNFIVGTELGTASTFTAVYSDGDKRISWGTGDGAQSYLQLVEKSGDALADGVEYPFGDLIHGNFPISPPSLRFVQLEWTLDVPTTPTGEPFNRTWTFNLYNWETTNGGDCPRDTDGVIVNPADGHPYLGDGNDVSTCDDAHNFGSVDTGSFEQDYTWVDSNNTIYYFKFSGFYDDQGTLTSTFWSPEDGVSTGSVTFSVTAKGQNDAYIRSRVWGDINNNGIQDADETSGPAGFIVELWEVNTTSMTETKVDETLTDASGNYSFVNVKKVRSGSGTAVERVYNIKFIAPSNLTGLFEFTQQSADEPLDSGTDSDADINGTTKNFSFPVDSNGTENIDAGIKRGAIGNLVWVDTNADGIQDPSEKGLADVVVNLYSNGGGTLLQTVSTDILGKYLFVPIPAGDYVVEFILPSDYTFSPKNAGGSTVDSDADPTTGRTDVINISLASGESSTMLDLDAGMIGAEPPEEIPPLGPPEAEDCPCNDVSSDSSSALNTLSSGLMILITLIIGLFFVRREEQLNANER